MRTIIGKQLKLSGVGTRKVDKREIVHTITYFCAVFLHPFNRFTYMAKSKRTSGLKPIAKSAQEKIVAKAAKEVASAAFELASMAAEMSDAASKLGSPAKSKRMASIGVNMASISRKLGSPGKKL
jgi:hypothetical protein